MVSHAENKMAIECTQHVEMSTENKVKIKLESKKGEIEIEMCEN